KLAARARWPNLSSAAPVLAEGNAAIGPACGSRVVETTGRDASAVDRRRMDGWVLIPMGRTKNEGLGCVSYANLHVLRCHPCACKFFSISFPLNSEPAGRASVSPPAFCRKQG